MCQERIRNLGFALIGAAISLAAWKSVAVNSLEAANGEPVGPESPNRRVLTIPVEIVETGEEPRLHEIRVSR